MEYKYFENEKKISIYFDEISENRFMTLFETLRCEFCKSKHLKFLISIDGLESTLNNFIKFCNSKDYCIYDNGRYNFFIKYLPTLYMLTDEWSDIVTFCEYIGSFNEGQMSLLFLDSDYNFSLADFQKDDYSKINEYYFKIDVISDGCEFEITTDPGKDNCKDVFMKIQTLLQGWEDIDNSVK